MENPKTNLRLQRHSSLPPRLQRHATLHKRLQRRSSLTPRVVQVNPRLPNKSNPYVGWFRHAPDTSVLQQYRLSTKRTCHVSTSLHMKNSPYIGWFRHAPPSRLHIPKEHLHKFDKEFETLFKRISKKDMMDCLVSGHLSGGAPESYISRQNEFQRRLQESSESAPSATVKVLTRLASWFLFPLAHDADSCGYRHTHQEGKTEVDKVLPHLLPPAIRNVMLEDDKSSSSCSTEDDSTVDSISNDNDVLDELDISVSSLAEAYYAHQAEKEIDQSSYIASGEDGQRLDYVITQMDIARMARNASRHLDVASILSLPTITYRSKSGSTTPPSSPQGEEETTQDPGWSWMIVHDGLNPDEQVTPKDDDDINVCVICLEHFVDGDRLRVLPCDHSFHVGCIDRWLSGSHSFEDCYTSGCPTCKKRPEAPPPSDGSVPSWAFTRIGESLAKDSVTAV